MKERTSRETIEWLRAGLKKAADNVEKQLKSRKESPEPKENDLESAKLALQLGHLELAQDRSDEARELFRQGMGILFPGGAIRPDLPAEFRRDYGLPLYAYLAGGRSFAAPVAVMVLNEFARQRLPGEVMVLHEGRCSLLAILAGDRSKAVWFSGLIEKKCREIVVSADGTMSPASSRGRHPGRGH